MTILNLTHLCVTRSSILNGRIVNKFEKNGTVHLLYVIIFIRLINVERPVDHRMS